MRMRIFDQRQRGNVLLLDATAFPFCTSEDSQGSLKLQ